MLLHPPVGRLDHGVHDGSHADRRKDQPRDVDAWRDETERVMYKHGHCYSSSTLSAKNDPVKRVIFDKGRLSLTDKYNNQIFFILNIDNNGSTTLFREERLLINDKMYEKIKIQYGSKDIMILLNKLKEFDNIVSIKWKLGDLLFDRTAYK